MRYLSKIMRIDESVEEVKVDKKDEKILLLLSSDSRISIQQIAKKLQLSRDVAGYRIKKLVEKGVISKFTLNLKYSDFFYTRFVILLQLREMPNEKENELHKFFLDYKEIVEVVSYFDKWDYQLIFQCKDIRILDSMINSFNKVFSSYVLDQEVMYLTTDFTAPKSSERFDSKDVELLKALLANSRMSAVELGQKTDLSSDAILYRLKKYSDMKFTIEINNNKLNLHTYDVLFSMRYFDDLQIAKLKTLIGQNKEIQDAHRLLGNWNLMLRIAVCEPMDLHRVVKKIRTAFIDNVKDFDIMHAYKELKNEPYL